MSPKEARAKRKAIVDELTAKWHARDCGCSEDSCLVTTEARDRADAILRLASNALGRVTP